MFREKATGSPILKNVKPFQDDNQNLTRDEKEKILDVFAMIDITLSTNVSPDSKNIAGKGMLLRAKSPYRMEKIIEQNKLNIFF